MPVLFVKLDKEIRKHLEILAEERGLDLTSYIKQIIYENFQDFLRRGGAIKGGK